MLKTIMVVLFARPARAAALLAALPLWFWMVPAAAQESGGKDLRLFYQQNCARCHGPDGSGADAEGKKLKGRDLTNPEWKQKTSDETMVEAVLNGKFFGLAMPGFKDKLTPAEAREMVTEIIRPARKGQPIAPAGAAAGSAAALMGPVVVVGLSH